MLNFASSVAYDDLVPGLDATRSRAVCAQPKDWPEVGFREEVDMFN